ncbi:MAG: protein translocase SEC61 complex subunit gamma [Nanoarchaeota archaeon]|nr:protein translocase SEC61 complex subunit gamma [Nanoarchaeota archaeon]MBU2459328.1 protein translocase SEC61 complex subunit gamma [Nanoarchaeota archaeon]
MTLSENIRSFIAKSKRVWLVLKKPSKNEYTTIAKISAIGILILGVLGFLISIIMKSFS